MQEYETTFVIDSLLKSEEIEGIINKYERFMSANGGDIRKIDHWGKKRLAYEIKKRQYGYYVYVRYAGPPNLVKSLEREFRLNESILRYLSVKLTPKMLKKEELAQGEGASKEIEKAPATEDKASESEQKQQAIDQPITAETAVAEEEIIASDEKSETSQEGDETKPEAEEDAPNEDEPEATIAEEDDQNKQE